MRNFETKIDNDQTSAGQFVAAEYNSLLGELKNVVTPITSLNELDNQQLVKSIDSFGKAMYYHDTGTTNNVVLVRGLTTATTESLFEGMLVFFRPSNVNDGASTIKVANLAVKPLTINGSALVGGELMVNALYAATYDSGNDWFNLALVALSGSPNSVPKVTNKTITTADGVNLSSNVGDIIIRPVNNIPSDYLECNGSYVSKTTFSDLYNVIGTTYGNGGSTFRIPDYRGEFLRGWDNGRGVNPSRVLGAFEDSTKISLHVYRDNGNSGLYLRSQNPDKTENWNMQAGDTHAFTSNAGSTDLNRDMISFRPRNVSVMYCIKY